MNAPLSARLRELVVDMAGTATLTCTFAPGGRLHGVGIRAPFYCANCGQARHWHHLVAEAATFAAAVEDGARAAAAGATTSAEQH
jgi:hypothetical protein